MAEFDMIDCKLPKTWPYVKVYGIADLHIGAPEFNEKLWLQFIKMVQDEPYALVALAGDMLNNGLKTSKTNVYEEVMTPRAQKEYLIKTLTPIKDKIVCIIPGNHEYRTAREADVNIIEDVAYRLGIHDRYRSIGAALKISVGNRSKNGKPCTYLGVVTHGATKNKHNVFTLHVDGSDFFISGHTHNPEFIPKGKLRLDPYNKTARVVPYKVMVCHSWIEYGGYGLRAEYPPTAPIEFPYFILSGTQKKLLYIEGDI